MNIGKIIEERRKELNLTLEEIGNAVGVSKSTVKKWESGYISNMKRDKISLLAKVLQISPTKLIDGDDPIEPNATILTQTDIRMIPLYESVSAGFGAAACDCIIDYIPTVIRNPYEAAETIAIRVSGDSMYPKIEDGDTIVVHKQTSVDNGQIAVVLIDGEDAVVKKVKYGSNWVDLVSINPEYKTRHFEDEELNRLQVLGLVRQIIKTV